jgi:hypothetical protein
MYSQYKSNSLNAFFKIKGFNLIHLNPTNLSGNIVIGVKETGIIGKELEVKNNLEVHGKVLCYF